MILRRALAASLLALAVAAPALAGDIMSYESGSGLAANVIPKTGGVAGQLVVSAVTDDGSTYLISGESLRVDSDVSPTALSGDVNDYNPASLSTSFTLRVDGGAANRNLTGLSGGASGRVVRLVNIGTTNNLVLKEQNASSSAANRFALGGYDVTLAPASTVALQYDNTSSRWRPFNLPGPLAKGIGGTAASTGAGAATNLSHAYTFDQTNTQASHTGDTAETKLASCAVPAGLMQTNGSLRVSYYPSRNSGGTSNATIKVRWGAANDLTGTQLVSFVIVVGGISYNPLPIIIANRASLSSQVTSSGALTASTGAAPITTAVNTANAAYVVVSGTLVNSGDTVSTEYVVCEYLPTGGN